MKKKTTQEIKIHFYPIQRKNSKKYNRKLFFKKNKHTPFVEIHSSLTTTQTSVNENQEHPIQKNKEHILAEIESFLSHREHSKRFNRTLLFKKNKGILLAKKPSKTSTITQILTENIIEIILCIIGLFYLTQPTIHNIKISFTLILISTFLIFLLTDKKVPTHGVDKTDATTPVYFEKTLQVAPLRKKMQSLPFSNTICLILILWVLLLFILVKDLEIYFILLFVGILITREITDQYISNTYKMKLNAYIIIFLATFIILIGKKIIEILQL